MWQYDNNYLSHFGIFGMHWGIRRYQNEDGSLTPEGKIRYSRQDVEKDFSESLKKNSEAANRVIENGPKIVEMANNLSKSYTSAFKKMDHFSKDIQDEIWKQLHNEYGVGPDDGHKELYEYVVESECVYPRIIKNLPKEVLEERKKFEAAQDAYWDDVKKVTKDITDKYGNTPISETTFRGKGITNAKFILDDLVSGSLDTSFNSYLSRHFDDYWVYDTEEFNNAVERLSKDFSIDKYEKKFG